MYYQKMNAEEKHNLVIRVLEAFEEPVTFEEFEEALGLICEDIAGLENMSGDSFRALLMACWSIKNRLTLTN